MRTTVELSGALAKRVRQYMKKHRRTFRAMVEDGLERVLEQEAPARGFRLREAAFGGRVGFAPGVSAEDLPALLREVNDPSCRRTPT